MSITKTLFSFAAKASSTRWLGKQAAPVIIHPFYHLVSDERLPHIHPLYTPQTVERFEAGLDYLCQYFAPVSIEEVLEYSKHPERLNKNAFHLSFDDGLAELYTTVMPILHRRNIPATVFVNTSFIDNKELFYRHKQALIIDKLKDKSEAKQILSIPYKDRMKLDKTADKMGIDFGIYLREQKPYLTTAQLKEMQQKGFTIGAHSIDHPPFEELGEEEQLRQIVESCAYVTEHFGEPRRYFSFPFTDEGIPDTVFTEAYKQGISLTFGITAAGTRFNRRHIARIDMETYGRTAKEAVNKALIKELRK